MKLTCLATAALLLGSIAAAQTTAPTQSQPHTPAAQSGPDDNIKQARKLSQEGKQDEAIALYKKAVEANPRNFDAFVGGGVALDLKGDHAGARQHFQRALDVATPEQKPQALRRMAFSYAFECKPAESAKYSQQIYDTRTAGNDFTGAAEIANELARIYLECGDIDNAEKWYKQGYESALRKQDLTGPERALWQFRWEHAQARIAARRGQKEEANRHVALAKRALDDSGNKDQQIFYPYLTGYVAYYLGDHKTAITDLQQAEQRDPFILVLLAQAFEKTGQQQQAQELYKKVLTINGHNPTNAFARPLAKKKLGM